MARTRFFRVLGAWINEDTREHGEHLLAVTASYEFACYQADRLGVGYDGVHVDGPAGFVPPEEPALERPFDDIPF